LALRQDIADEAQGSVLIVAHGDAVNSSVTRLRPWALVHPVHHTGFTAAYRDEKAGARRRAPRALGASAGPPVHVKSTCRREEVALAAAHRAPRLAGARMCIRALASTM